MNKATSVYVLMLAAFGAGLWAILSVGSIFLDAPTDLSGRWELRPLDVSDVSLPRTLSIEQSGRYCNVIVDQKSHSLRLTNRPNPVDPLTTRSIMAGNGMELIFVGHATGDIFALRAQGNELSGEWRAVRVEHSHASRSATPHARL